MSPKQSILWQEFTTNETVTLARAAELIGGDIYCNVNFYVGQTLRRMMDNGWIERVGRGIYQRRKSDAPTGKKVQMIPCHGTSCPVMPSMREWALKHGLIETVGTTND